MNKLEISIKLAELREAVSDVSVGAPEAAGPTTPHEPSQVERLFADGRVFKTVARTPCHSIQKFRLNSTKIPRGEVLEKF